MARNYLRRYTTNHREKAPGDFDKIIFTRPLPKGVTVGCALWQDGGCTKEGGEWTIATGLGAPVILCTYHADRVCWGLIQKGVRFERTLIPREG